MDWQSVGGEEVLKMLSSATKGISNQEAATRLKKHGRNEIKREDRINPIAIFLGQFKSFLVMILIAAAAISLASGAEIDAAVILLIVVLNAIFGFVQEYRAEKSIEALKKMVTPMATVLRDGVEAEIEAVKLVPGDVILLNAGDKVPADAKLIGMVGLSVDESILTGESVPAEKGADSNLVFMGTVVTRGKATAVVFGTGMGTEIGKIAHMVQEEKEETQLQQRLDQFGKQLGVAALFLCAVIFALGIAKGEPVLGMFTTAVSLAVAAIPEGLPAIVTITLAIGIQRMARQNAIVRKLSSVESLGSATYICSDKTGTITRNEMTVRQLYADGQFVEVAGRGYEPTGGFHRAGKAFDTTHLDLLLKAGTLCNSASLHKGDEGWKIIGDPTEGALVVAAAKAGYDQQKLRADYPQVGEIPFESERRMMSTVHEKPSGRIAFTKGAPEIIVRNCASIFEKGQVRKMTIEDKRRIIAANNEMAKEALRVLGAAYRDVDEHTKNPETEMIFLGLFGMIDPPREEAKEAIRVCNSAGIRVVMITGDNEITAEAIAKEVGILGDGRSVMTGGELGRIDEDKLSELIGNIGVFARVRPEHKVRIVKALQRKGEVVAMTGDGVNDAPSLKAADVGISMGITGTDVAKEASDMVLADDNFATIVSAVREGRTIFTNIKKSIKYLISSNIGKLGTVFGAVILNLGVPLSPLQILWTNLVTDGLPALALGVEKHEANVMTKKPTDPRKGILSKRNLADMLGIGAMMAAGTISIYWLILSGTGELERARTAAFTMLVFFPMMNALSYRSELRTCFDPDLWSNKAMLAALISAVGLQLAIVYVPALQPIFRTVPIQAVDLLAILAISVIPFIALEFVRHKRGLPH